MIFSDFIASPIGYVIVKANDSSVASICFVDEQPLEVNGNPVTALACSQLAEYFAGNRRDFDLPLSAKGTEFQRTVWAGLGRIPYGITCSYAELAADIGRVGAARAVGTANGQNKIAIVVPCHRVIGADGRLAGYASGEHRKAWLLQHESSQRELPV